MFKAILTPAILTSASSRVDGSLSLRFSTPELDAASKTAFFEVLQQNLKLLIQPEEATPEALHEVKNEFDQKTPGQRLRAVLFLCWKQAGEVMDFEVFYRREMEKLIDGQKAKLSQP